MNRLPKTANSHISLEGSLLVATPKVSDALFGRSVCLIVEHSHEGGAAGVVLNRPVISDVKPLWNELTAGSIHTASPPPHFHFGGPVSGPVVAVHDQESLADAGNGHGVYLAAQADTLKKLVYVSPEHYRLVIGHAAWKQGQLEKEIQEGVWYVLPAIPELVFSSDDEMWVRSIRHVGATMVQEITGIKHLPSNPQWN